MNKIRNVFQGDIYICNLNDNIDSEQGGDRPCIIIQLDILNRTSNNVIVVPITSKIKNKLPTHVELTKEKYNFLKYKNNTVLCENIRSISKNRLGKYIGKITEDDLNIILKAKEYAFVELK